MAAFVVAVPVVSAAAASVASGSSSCSSSLAARAALRNRFIRPSTKFGFQSASVPITFHSAPLFPAAPPMPAHAVAASQVSTNVKIDTDAEDFVVTVEAADREGLLEGLLAIFRGFGFAVQKASVQTEGTQVNDVFHIRHTEVRDANAINNEILPSLKEALVLEIGSPTKPKSEANVLHCNVSLKGNRVFIHDAADGSQSEITVETSDRSHLLHELVATMKYLELNILSAEISTEGDRVLDKFIVTSKGLSLSEGRKAAVVNALTTVLMCDPGHNVVSDDHDSY